MTRSVEDGDLPLQHLDLSAEVPSPKAYSNPLTRAKADIVRVKIWFRNMAGLSSSVEVHGGLQRPVTYALICGTSAGIGVTTAFLCHVWHSSGWIAAVLGVSVGGLVLALGLIFGRPPQS